MDYKKINKKGESSLTGLVVSMLIVVGVFVVLFAFMTEQYENNDAQLDSKYNETYNRLINVSNNLDNDINQIQESLDNIQEADNTFQTAWNGLKGLGQVLTLPISFISRGAETYDAVALSADVVTRDDEGNGLVVITLFRIGLIAFIIFLVLAVLTGGNPKI